MRIINARVSSLFAFLLLSGLIGVIKAQKYVVINFRSDSSPVVMQKDEVKEMEFFFKNRILTNIPSHIDTLQYSADACDGFEYTAFSYAPLTAKVDCDWADVVLVQDTAISGERELYYKIKTYVKPNAGDTDRHSIITLSSEGADDLTINIVQKRYLPSFQYPSLNSYGTRTTSTTVEWSDTVEKVECYPNFGFKVKSYPEWVDGVEIEEYKEGEDIAEAPYNTTAKIRLKHNISNKNRVGVITLLALNGEELMIDICQKSIGYDNIHAQMKALSSDMHFQWGYGSLMHVRDVLTGDMTVVDTGYDWYKTWAVNKAFGNSIYSQYVWEYYRDLIFQVNLLLANVRADDESDDAIAMRSVAYSFRAMAYLDYAQMYEFLPNDKVSSVNAVGNDVTNLTVPIVTEPVIPGIEVINVPRATRYEMAVFILSDLDKALAGVEAIPEADKNVPHKDAIYGLKARLYMWLGDYENAKKFARLAIENSAGHIMTKEECLSKTAGFNKPAPWMWAFTTNKDDDVVKSGILNWVSWMSPELQNGYSNVGATSMIDAAMYKRINNSDFRKLMYKAPAGHALEKKVPYINAVSATDLPEYAGIKFRPDKGNTQENTIGSATSIPLMRVEEMLFIEAEAAERIKAGEGKKLLESFMQEHRDPAYTFPANADAIDEILFQKRVELWGEGIAFFDIKRANLSVIRYYDNTNVSYDRQFNTDGRPAWMNMQIPVTAKDENSAIEGYENPDPVDCYELIR